MTLSIKTIAIAAITFGAIGAASAQVTTDVNFTVDPNESAAENYAAITKTAKRACKTEYGPSVLRNIKATRIQDCTDELVSKVILAFDHGDLTAFHEAPAETRIVLAADSTQTQR